MVGAAVPATPLSHLRRTVPGMSDHASAVRQYWATAEARDWDGFAALLADDIRYDIQQTGETITGLARYLEFNRDYPGDWHLVVREVLVDGDRAVSRIEFTVDGETQHAISFFSFAADGRISTILDYWPESYQAPPGREHLID